MLNSLSKLITDLSTKKLTRGQFLATVVGGSLGIAGLFRFVQAINTPDLADSYNDVFGEREYGHAEGQDPHEAKKYTYNSEDVFG